MPTQSWMDYKEYERTFPGNFLRHLCSHNLLLKFDSKSTKISSKILKCNPNITKVRSEKYKSAVLTVYLKAPPNEQPLFGKREILLVKHQCLSVWPPQKHVLDQQRLLVESKQLFLNTDKQNLLVKQCLSWKPNALPKGTSILDKKIVKCLPNTFDQGFK